MSSRRTGVCWYCGLDRKDLSNEHIIPIQFRGRLVTSRVCEPCGSTAAAIERQIAAFPWVAETVGRLELRDRSGHPQRPRQEVSYEDGSTGQIEQTKAGPKPVFFRPRLKGIDDDGIEYWEVPQEATPTFLARRRKAGKKVKIIERREATYVGAETHYGLGTANAGMWARFAAKTALGFASLLGGDDWLASPGAKALQELFHRGVQPPFPIDVLPDDLEVEASDAISELLEPSETLIRFSPLSDGGVMELLLLGRFRYRLRVPELGGLESWPTWLNSPDGPAPCRRGESFAAVLARLDRRARDTGGTL